MWVQTTMLIKSLIKELREPSSVYVKLWLDLLWGCLTDSPFGIRAILSKVSGIVPIRANVLCAD